VRRLLPINRQTRKPDMKRSKKKHDSDSIWRRELIPEDSVWRRELIPEDSIWGRDLFAFGGRKSSRCQQCPILMVPEERRCNRFDAIPDDIWSGIEACPLYEETCPPPAGP